MPYNSTVKIFDNYVYPNNDAKNYDVRTNITSSNWDNLGTYATKERALEVLDKIQQFMDNIGIANSSIAKEISSVIYEMPKE